MGYKLKDLDDQWLLKQFFFGVYVTTGDGILRLVNPVNVDDYLDPIVLNDAIEASIDRLEGLLDLSIRKEEGREEFHPYDAETFVHNIAINTDRVPIASVESISITYGESGRTVWTIPEDTIQKVNERFGTLRVLPYQSLELSALGTMFFSTVAGVGGFDYAPSMLKVVYTAGLDALDRDLPYDIVNAIGLLASIDALNILGDLQIGAGIASISTSIVGLSQSINTTASAENHAFSARVLQYNNKLFGQQGVPGVIQTLQTKWRRVGVALL